MAYFIGGENLFKRTDAVIDGHLADMRMIDDDQIVTRGKLGQRMAFKAF